MGARSSNTNREGSRSKSQNRLLNGHVANFFNSNLNAGAIGPNAPQDIVASGGVKFNVGAYTYHLFRSSGTFTVASGQDPAEVVAFGGGGSGGFFYGDGGGAGGGLHAPMYPLAPGPYTVTIGAGAPGPPASSGPGVVGGATQFYPTPVGAGEGANNMYARGGGGGGYKQNEPHPAPGSGFPWNPLSGTGAGGGTHNGSTPETTPNFPTSTQHPAVPPTGRYGARGGDMPYYESNGCGGGGMGGGGEFPGSFRTSEGGLGKAFSNFPGPGMYDAMPSPEQSSFGGTLWRDTLGPTGLIGGGGGGYNANWGPPTAPGARGPGGGGKGSAGSLPTADVDGVDYTGSGGGIYSPTGPGDGGDGGVWIRYLT